MRIYVDVGDLIHSRMILSHDVDTLKRERKNRKPPTTNKTRTDRQLLDKYKQRAREYTESSEHTTSFEVADLQSPYAFNLRINTLSMNLLSSHSLLKEIRARGNLVYVLGRSC